MMLALNTDPVARATRENFKIKPIPCLHCGFCCKQAPCPHGQWNKDHDACLYLTENNLCAKYDEIIANHHDWKYCPAFGEGCCSNLNSERMKIVRKLKETQKCA